MFLEMVKDMPRGRSDSLSRMLVPMLVAAGVLAGVLAIWIVGDTGRYDDLQRQIDRQVESAGVMLLDDPQVPRSGERAVTLLVDGRRTEGVIRVHGDQATLLVRVEDGSWLPADVER